MKFGVLNLKLIFLKLDMDFEKMLGCNMVEEVYIFILLDIEYVCELINKEKWEIVFLYWFNVLFVDVLQFCVSLYMGVWLKCLELVEVVLVKKFVFVDMNEIFLVFFNYFELVELIIVLEQVMGFFVNNVVWVFVIFLVFYQEGDKRLVVYFVVLDENGN